MTLGGTYLINRREGADERLRWSQAAIAAALLLLCTAAHAAGSEVPVKPLQPAPAASSASSAAMWRRQRPSSAA